MQDFEDQLLLAQTGGAGDGQIFSDLVELLDAHVLQLDQIERGRTVLRYGAAATVLAALALVSAAVSAVTIVRSAAAFSLVAALGPFGRTFGWALDLFGGRRRRGCRSVPSGCRVAGLRLLRLFLGGSGVARLCPGCITG